MDLIFVLAALSSAALHAGWNAAVKASPRPADAMTAQMLVGAIAVIPLLAWTGLPSPAAWPWIAASTILNLITVRAMLRGYELAGFGVVYPVVRAISVLLVVPLAAAMAGEQPSSAGLAGVALIAGALALLAVGNRGEGAFPVRAFLWITLSGVTTAAYVICDAKGVRASGAPIAYGFVVSVTNALVMLAAQGRAAAPARMLPELARATPIAAASMASYLLILWVFANAPIAPAAALRDTSAVFALVIAVMLLGEPYTRLRLVAIALAALAVPLLRLA